MEVDDAAMLLYVEDEALTRDLVMDTLRDAGFAVTEAADGPQALEILEARADAFRALITDVNLGKGPDGWAVARRAREMVPTMPVVYVSGASDKGWTSKGVPHSVMVAKPFAPAQIVVAVSSLLIKTDA